MIGADENVDEASGTIQHRAHAKIELEQRSKAGAIVVAEKALELGGEPLELLAVELVEREGSSAHFDPMARS
jgi:hypothetical protein